MALPFTPVVCEHAARFTGCSPWDVSRDPDLLFARHAGACRAYPSLPKCMALYHHPVIAAEGLGHPVPCILGGNTDPVLDDLLSTGTNHLVCNVETNQAALVEAVTRARCVMGTGALPLETPIETIQRIRDHLALRRSSTAVGASI